MRDLLAGIVALGLLLAAASLATTLTVHRRRRERERAGQRALGRTIVAEIPAGDDLALFTEDDRCFYYGRQTIPKETVVAARVLINGAPIASAARPGAGGATSSGFDDRPEGIARDRWDVAIDTCEPGSRTGGATATTLIECGAIRERVSQELARGVFEALKREIGRPKRSDA